MDNSDIKKSKMSYTENELAKDLESQEYKYGFVTNLESEQVPKGLSEETIRIISAKKEDLGGVTHQPT